MKEKILDIGARILLGLVALLFCYVGYKFLYYITYFLFYQFYIGKLLEFLLIVFVFFSIFALIGIIICGFVKLTIYSIERVFKT